MTGIEAWSTTAGSNNSAPPNGAPEGCPPSVINDIIRQNMAAIRTWYQDAQYINLGHTPTYVSATQFTITADQTAYYTVGRIVRLIGSTPFTAYGIITVSAFTTLTTVTIAATSGTLDNTVTAVSVSILTSAALNALSSLTPAANKLSYYSGATSAALADLSSFGRSLIDDSDAPTARQTLGVIDVLGYAVSDEVTTITTGTAKITFRMPSAFTLTDVRASLSTASSSGVVTVDINEGGSTILSTKLSIDANEKTSTTAATPVVISDTALADDAEITVDIDAAGTGAKGLKILLIGRKST